MIYHSEIWVNSAPFALMMRALETLFVHYVLEPFQEVYKNQNDLKEDITSQDTVSMIFK
jgi:hypothetical protein